MTKGHICIKEKRLSEIKRSSINHDLRHKFLQKISAIAAMARHPFLRNTGTGFQRHSDAVHHYFKFVHSSTIFIDLKMCMFTEISLNIMLAIIC